MVDAVHNNTAVGYELKKNADMKSYANLIASDDLSAAIIDFNGDGKLNYGTKSGDAIKLFNWDTKKVVKQQLIKPGEQGKSTPAGQVETTTGPLGRSLLNTYKGKSQAEINKMTPGAILVNPEGKDSFEKGSTIMFKTKDSSRHNVHYVKDGELPATTLKMTGAKSLTELKSDKGIMAGDVVWYDVPTEK